MSDQRVTRLAPAKVNLGLEVIGRRPDGFHDIATVMQTVSLIDSMSIEPAPALTVTIDVDELDPVDNLVTRAARLLAGDLGREPDVRIDLRKQIPIAAGLGGASSDASATLLALSDLWSADLTDDEMIRLAAQLGSDVPFFLSGGTAFVAGRGELVQPLRPLAPCWVVIVAPTLQIERKTATLYQLLEPADFSSGERVRALARRIGAGDVPPASELVNPFARPLYALFPELRAVPEAFRRAGVPNATVSGAGPSHFTVIAQERDAMSVADRLRRELSATADVIVAQPIPPSAPGL